MIGLFRKPKVVDQNTADEIFACFDWMIECFDANTFLNNTALVLPNNVFFPDRANNESDMAKLISQRVIEYSGLRHWPFTIVPPEEFNPITPPQLQLDHRSRAIPEKTDQVIETLPLVLSYSRSMMKQPMDLVTNMSKNIAQHYLNQSGQAPPSGENNFNATSEMLSIFMGFGVLLANSAYTFRGSCARCVDPRAIRSAALHENEAIFSLALFCTLKNTSTKSVTPSLKPYLRTAFTKALRQINVYNKPTVHLLREKLANTTNII
ncbi:MAG: hypothetical protein ACI93R_001395 [Flavobacteriales bacterium]|jgi:hypothetical protein